MKNGAQIRVQVRDIASRADAMPLSAGLLLRSKVSHQKRLLVGWCHDERCGIVRGGVALMSATGEAADDLIHMLLTCLKRADGERNGTRLWEEIGRRVSRLTSMVYPSGRRSRDGGETPAQTHQVSSTPQALRCPVHATSSDWMKANA